MALDSRIRYTTKARDFIEEVAKCQTHFSGDRSPKKKRNLERLRQIHQRRRVEETKLVERPEYFERPARRHYEGRICAAQEYFGAVRYKDWAKLREHLNDK